MFSPLREGELCTLFWTLTHIFKAICSLFWQNMGQQKHVHALAFLPLGVIFSYLVQLFTTKRMCVVYNHFWPWLLSLRSFAHLPKNGTKSRVRSVNSLPLEVSFTYLVHTFTIERTKGRCVMYYNFWPWPIYSKSSARAYCSWLRQNGKTNCTVISFHWRDPFRTWYRYLRLREGVSYITTFDFDPHLQGYQGYLLMTWKIGQQGYFQNTCVQICLVKVRLLTITTTDTFVFEFCGNSSCRP